MYQSQPRPHPASPCVHSSPSSRAAPTRGGADAPPRLGPRRTAAAGRCCWGQASGWRQAPATVPAGWNHLLVEGWSHPAGQQDGRNSACRCGGGSGGTRRARPHACLVAIADSCGLHIGALDQSMGPQLPKRPPRCRHKRTVHTHRSRAAWRAINLIHGLRCGAGYSAHITQAPSAAPAFHPRR